MERINAYQVVLSRWEGGVMPNEARTPELRFDRAMEEVEELVEAHHKRNGEPTTHKEAAMEAVDTVIALLGYVNSLGYDLENLLEEKIDVMHRKYNHVTNQQLRSTGMDWKSAIEKQKTIWKENH